MKNYNVSFFMDKMRQAHYENMNDLQFIRYCELDIDMDNMTYSNFVQVKSVYYN